MKNTLQLKLIFISQCTDACSSGTTVIYKLHKNKLAIAFPMNNIHHRIKAHT